MSTQKTNAALPQLQGGLFLSDAGLETCLIFHDGIELPEFSSIVMMQTDSGREKLRSYFQSFLDLAAREGTGFVLETPTWRASTDWGVKLGLTADQLDMLNQEAVGLMQELRAASRAGSRVVISGQLGPRGDGYVAGELMTVPEAARYHQRQISVMSGAGVDMVTAMTINNVSEAMGIVAAAAEASIPVVIGFTVETNGRLVTGDSLESAITAVDGHCDAPPAYYMVNCAHPSHFATVLEEAPWARRIRSIRANASRCSHAELDEAEVLDDGDPAELADDYKRLLSRHPQINVLGGCCGTDLRHIEAIAQAVREVDTARGD